MKKDSLDIDLVQRLSPAAQGVFTVSDLQTMLSPKQSDNFLRRIRGLEGSGVLTRFIRGIYVTKNFSLPALSQRLSPRSYISFANVLARELVIGTQPGNLIMAVKVGKRREYRSTLGTILHLGISPDLYFGFQARDGIYWANKEKAFLDTLYFYQKGLKPYFDIYSDIDVGELDQRKIATYLKRYKNSKFRAFVKGCLK